MDNIVLTALKTRRSIRSYKPDQITNEELLAVQDASLVLGNMMNAARAEDARMLAYERRKDDGAAVF